MQAYAYDTWGTEQELTEKAFTEITDRSMKSVKFSFSKDPNLQKI